MFTVGMHYVNTATKINRFLDVFLYIEIETDKLYLNEQEGTAVFELIKDFRHNSRDVEKRY